MYEFGAIITLVITLIFYIILKLFAIWSSYGAPDGMKDIIGEGDYTGGIEASNDFRTSEETISDLPDKIPESSLMREKRFWDAFYNVNTVRDGKLMREFHDIDQLLKYREDNSAIVQQTHNGQRKLLLSEMDFFNLLSQEDGKRYGIDEPCYVIYAGSSPCMHAGPLLDLYPKMTLIAIDPMPMHIYMDTDPRTTHYSHSGTLLQLSSQDADYGAMEYPLEAGDVARMQKVLIDGEEKVMNLDEESTGDFTNKDDVILAKIREGKHRVYFFRQLFTHKLAETLSALSKDSNVFFWSDIRTRREDVSDPTQFEVAIFHNLAMQLEWGFLINGIASMIKFRLPFISPENIEELRGEGIKRHDVSGAVTRLKSYGIDLLADTDNQTYDIPEGRIRLQARMPSTSTETRLISRMENGKTMKISMEEYEERLFYYNRIIRPFRHTANPLASRDLCHDNCNDCALESAIISEYTGEMDHNAFLRKLDYIFKRPLCRAAVHGYLWEPMSKEDVLKVYDDLIEFWKKEARENK